MLHQNALAEPGSKVHVLSPSEAGTKEIWWGKHSCLPKACESAVRRTGAMGKRGQEEQGKKDLVHGARALLPNTKILHPGSWSL